MAQRVLCLFSGYSVQAYSNEPGKDHGNESLKPECTILIFWIPFIILLLIYSIYSSEARMLNLMIMFSDRDKAAVRSFWVVVLHYKLASRLRSVTHEYTFLRSDIRL